MLFENFGRIVVENSVGLGAATYASQAVGRVVHLFASNPWLPSTVSRRSVDQRDRDNCGGVLYGGQCISSQAEAEAEAQTRSVEPNLLYRQPKDVYVSTGLLVLVVVVVDAINNHTDCFAWPRLGVVPRQQVADGWSCVGPRPQMQMQILQS